MKTVSININKSSVSHSDFETDSLVLFVDNAEEPQSILNLRYLQGEWIVALTGSGASIYISWPDFVKIFSECAVFIGRETTGLLNEQKWNKDNSDN